MSSLPVVNFDAFMEPVGAIVGQSPTKEQLEAASQIDEAFREHGFLFLNGIGISDEELQTYYESAAMLFALPDEEKKDKLKPIDRTTNAGYAGLGVEALNSKRKPDLKEIYNIPNPTYADVDFRGCPEGFEVDFRKYWEKMKTAATNFGVACAVALDMPRDYFLDAIKEFNVSIVRLNYYPPCDYEEGKTTGDDLAASIRVGEHTDFGMFTFLYCDGSGLQVKAVEGGEIGGSAGGELGGWADIPPPEGAKVVVNTGALMARWTNDVWRASAHRVIVSSPLQAMSHRFSIACFVEPDAGAIIEVDPKFVKQGEKPKYEPISGKAYLEGKLAEIRPTVD